jgi:NADH-quinone oxidoreductase subunit E
VARLNPHNLRRTRDLIALYPEPRSALIPALHVLQEQDGYLSEDGMEHVAEVFGLAAAEVRGTATFYDMFHFEPVGKYLIAVCTNIACMLQGAYRLLEHAQDRLQVAPGGTTRDGMFTLEDAECLALCGNAPCVTVNWRFFGDVDTAAFDQLIDGLRAGRLDEDVPPHGTLSRVERTVGLQAAGEPAPSPNGKAQPTPPRASATRAPRAHAPSAPASGGPAPGGPASGNPAPGNPASGGPASGGPASGGPASGNPASGNPAPGNPAPGAPDPAAETGPPDQKPRRRRRKADPE